MGRILNPPVRRSSDPVGLTSRLERPCLTRMLQSRLARRIAAAAVCIVILVMWKRNRLRYYLHNETLPDHSYTGPEEYKHYHAASNTAAAASLHPEKIDWSRFAYVQYVTDSEYLCNSVMVFESLHRLGSLADRVMMYPGHMLDPSATEGKTEDAKLILRARDEYNVKLMPINELRERAADGELPLYLLQNSFVLIYS